MNSLPSRISGAMLERVVGTRQAMVVTLNGFDQFRARR